ncbi:MAG: glycosyltransferase family 2 protein [Verrucomicrobiota bacterium]
MPGSCKTPVVFIVFNRPEVTARVFAAIRAARPAALYLIADGPRTEVATDAASCAAARAAIEQIDWPCEVFRKFAPQNIGLRRNVSEGLDWVFAQAEEAIILEDDCLPDPTFFPLCEILLERFREDEHVGVIAGTSPHQVHAAPPAGDSYRFSRYSHIWGWATWRRAWKFYDDSMSEWPGLRDGAWLRARGLRGSAVNFWRKQFDDCYLRHSDGLDTWDVPWTFACWLNNLVSIVPRQNLVENLGFGAEAHHTRRSSKLAGMAVVPMGSSLVHPIAVRPYEAADDWIQKKIFESATPLDRVFWALRLPIPIWLVRRVQRWLRKL